MATTETTTNTGQPHGADWCPCGYARGLGETLRISSVSPDCEVHEEATDCRRYITSAERGERVSCFEHGTDCGHDHWLDGASPDGDIDECPWQCGGADALDAAAQAARLTQLRQEAEAGWHGDATIIDDSPERPA